MEKQDMQRIIEMLVKAEANQEKAEADRKADKEEIKTNLAKMEADRKADQEKAEANRKIDKEERKAAQVKADADRVQMQEMMKMVHTCQAITDAVLPAMQVMETSRKDTAAIIKPETKVKTMACQEMEAHQEEEEPTSADRKPEAADQREAPVDDAEVMPVGEPKKKRRRDRKLAAENRRQKPKTLTRENCGPQKRLAVAHRGTTCRAKVAQKTPIHWKMSRRATVAWRKRNIFRQNMTRRATLARRKENSVGRDRSRDKMMLGTSKGWALGRDNRCNHNVTRGTRIEAYKKMTGQETAKRIIEPHVPSQNFENWTPWRGRPPPKQKKGNDLYGRNRW
jgi:hypothetical protein